MKAGLKIPNNVERKKYVKISHFLESAFKVHQCIQRWKCFKSLKKLAAHPPKSHNAQYNTLHAQ